MCLNAKAREPQEERGRGDKPVFKMSKRARRVFMEGLGRWKEMMELYYNLKNKKKIIINFKSFNL